MVRLEAASCPYAPSPVTHGAPTPASGAAAIISPARRGLVANRDAGVDARHGHQPAHHRVAQCRLCEVQVDLGELIAVEVELPQQGPDQAVFVLREVLAGQPAVASVTEQVGDRRAGHEVAGQDRVDLVLETGALAHQVRPAGDDPPQDAGVLVRQPDRRQEVRGQQLGQDPGALLIMVTGRTWRC